MNHLNSAQQDAVNATDGPLMILAGAGSGKTRTLVSKIIYLIEEKNVAPYRILALTFSNRAAREMKGRVSNEMKTDVSSLRMTTFHSFCAQVLRSEVSYLGLSRNFTIYNETESRTLIKKILARLGISTKEQSPYEIMSYIGHIKNQGLYEGRDSIDDCKTDKENPFYRYYQEYEHELHESNAVDFGGLITGVLQLFESYPDILDRYQKRFDYILVDEYQDTNRSQFHLLKWLSQVKRNICVVGDEDQSIYSWRGADIRNILDFEETFTDTKLIKLEQSYRSSKTVIDAARHVISNNQARKGKTMWTENSEGEDIEIVECVDDRREGEFISREILEIVEKGADWRDIAVFYRNNSQSRIIEDYLRKEAIPHRVVAGIKFYERKEVKDMIAYMRIVVNPLDSLALSRIINIPARGVGVTTLRKLEQTAVQNEVSLWEIIQDIVDNPENHQSLRLNFRIRSALGQFCVLINECILMENRKELPTQIYEKLLRESGFHESLKASKDYESLVRLENMDEVYNAIKQFEETQETPTLLGYLETITLDDSKTESPGVGEVSLMTVHGSKGLEFNYVFMTGIEEKIFPSIKSIDENDLGLEEERRLFYVAMTRVMKKLYISFSQSRMLFGSLKFNGPSRFIREIPDKYCSLKTYLTEKTQRLDKPINAIDYGHEYSQVHNLEKQGPFGKKKKKKYSSTYSKGSKIRHSLYGEGHVVNSQGNGPDEKVVIQFFNGAKKNFLVKFAPITRL